jgi:1-acyl-sn-glycerol-3-phosphate acyltransferase
MRVIRSIAYSLWFYVVSVVLVSLGQILAVVAPRSLVAYARLWSRSALYGLPICGISVEVSGWENLPKGGPMLIAAMHQSAFDTLFWFNRLPYCRYVVKVELMRIPLFGRMARLSGQIGVDRSGGATTMRSLLRQGGAALAEGSQVVIFPEGTRAPHGQMAPLQPGFAALARSAGVKVVPVTTDSGLCWGKGFLGMHPGVIHVVIHPPIEAGLPRDVLMARLQSVFDDGVEALRAANKGVDNSVH